MRHYVSVQVLKNIYYALINSYLRYGLMAWGNASTDVLQPLTVITNRAVRIMSFAPLGRIDTQPIFKHFQLLNVDNTFLLETAKFIYKLKNSLIPSVLVANHFTRTRTTPAINSNGTYSLRPRSNTTVVPHCLLSNYAQKSIQNRMHVMWDNIPNDIVKSDSLNLFKKHYKQYLISTINEQVF